MEQDDRSVAELVAKAMARKALEGDVAAFTRQPRGFGQKSGIYWALNSGNVNIIWRTSVGPGGTLGGIEWGLATDGMRIYSGIGNNSTTSPPWLTTVQP
jgi:hypothetical protein